MAKNLLGLNGKLTDDEWLWIARFANWDDKVYYISRIFPPLIKKSEDNISRAELLLLDRDEILRRAEKSVTIGHVWQAEKRAYEKLKRFVDEG